MTKKLWVEHAVDRQLSRSEDLYPTTHLSIIPSRRHLEPEQNSRGEVLSRHAQSDIRLKDR